MSFSKYRWSTRRFWKSWTKQDFKRLYYKLRYGWKMGLNATMLPSTGKGKYVSVYRKGDIIQIVDEQGGLEYDEVRLIPFQPNHGIMVERWKDGRLNGRNHLDIRQLSKNIIFASNVEELARKSKTK